MLNIDIDDEGLVCEVCRQRQPESGRVCETDRESIADRLCNLIGQVARLEVDVTPGARRSSTDRVSTSKGAAPTPARLDALSLLGPGAAGVSAMLHPKVRHWQTTREADVHVLRTATTVNRGREVKTADITVERRTIVEWHRELARDDDGALVLAADDDQIGTLPPRAWLASKVNEWQGHLAGVAVRRTRPVPWDAMLNRSRGDLVRIDDPLADEMTGRFGQATSQVVAELVGYLLERLDDACDRPGIPIGAFAGELRAMSAELTRVLGENPDQQWLGRCPARISEPDEETSRPCGAGLWQDPHASQVQCPRCHSTWGPRRLDLLFLATEMRRTWPVDRRRRYTAEERDTTRRPRCPGCGVLATVQWKEVTGVGETTRTWQPVTAVCANACPEAGQVI